MIFDVPLFLLISAFAVVAIAFAVPSQVKGLLSRRSDVTAPVPMPSNSAATEEA